MPRWPLGAHRPLAYVVFGLLFRMALSLIKSRTCGLNCSAFCFLSALTTMNNSSYFLRFSIDLPLPPPFVVFLEDANNCTMVAAIWPHNGQHFFLHLYQPKQKVAFTGIASSWSSVHVPFSVWNVQQPVLRINLIGFAPVKKYTYLSVL